MKHTDIIIYTDGASRGNPGPGGWGTIIVYDDGEARVKELGGGDKHTTNNKMELTACISALSFVKGIIGAHTITLHVDSSYVINGITKWVVGWKKNGWVNSKKESVLNRELWEMLDECVSLLRESGCTMRWEYTPGHAGIPGNDRADTIATMFADEKHIKLFNGPRAEYEIDLTPHKGDEKLLAQKKSKTRSNANIKAYSYLSVVDGKLATHRTWAECEKRVKGVRGAKFKKSISAEDERVILRSWGF